MKNLTQYAMGFIIIPRWVLMVKYGVFIFIGITVILASSPSLDLTTASGYTPIWGGMLALSGAACTIGSLTIHWEPLERWAVLLLTALLIGYAAAPISLLFNGDTDKAAYSTIALALSILPAVRAWQLIRRTGTKHG